VKKVLATGTKTAGTIAKKVIVRDQRPIVRDHRRIVRDHRQG